MREMRQRDEGWQMQLFHSKGDGQRGTVHGQSDKQCERGPTPDQTVDKLWRCLQHLENQLDRDRPAQAQEDQMCARLSNDEPKETVDISKVTKLFFANVTYCLGRFDSRVFDVPGQQRDHGGCGTQSW